MKFFHVLKELDVQIKQIIQIRAILTSKSLINESTTTNESQNNLTLTSSNSSGPTKFTATALAEVNTLINIKTLAILYDKSIKI